jgi:hypothetical protein
MLQNINVTLKYGSENKDTFTVIKIKETAEFGCTVELSNTTALLHTIDNFMERKNNGN